ncbi:hypothetical protein AM592_05695 [Bacillus gobiensis]|uniref:Uncharacterized protein n=1 Tax=Bacillus gobiensis TaxID=1441095 RepID=A0A0M4G7S5_9BACI|nr:hypothetical protein AM592_05695 [Bacillus gobiensis]
MFHTFPVSQRIRAIALQWAGADLNNACIVVDHTIDYEAEDDEELFGDTKIYGLKQFKEKYKHDLHLVFCREVGSCLANSTLFTAFRWILKKAYLPGVLFHSLRQTYSNKIGAQLKVRSDI